MKGFASLEKQVVETGLCVHCGTCVGVCSANALEIEDILGRCVPRLVGKCTECGLCLQTCPGKAVDFGSLTKDQPSYLINSPLLGYYNKLFIGYSRDEGIRRRGASGGMGTAILLHLLEQKEVDGVVALDFSTTRPWFPEVKIAESNEEIIQAAQSKYFIYPHNKILKVLRESSIKKVAYMGLPCQVHGIRKAIQNKVPGTEKIKYVLGIYCGNNLYYEATVSLLKRFGIDNLNQITRLAYRDGKYPGDFVVESKNAKKRTVDKITFNYLSFFYTPFRCLFCIDQTNEFADLAIGDAWTGTFTEKSGEGKSIIVVRNSNLLDILNRGKKEGRYEIEEISVATAVRMHSNVLDNKKTGAHARMNIWHKAGKEVPEYFVKMGPILLKRHFFEALNLFVLFVCSLNISKAIVSRISLRLISPLMKFVRGIWREKTSKNYSAFS